MHLIGISSVHNRVISLNSEDNVYTVDSVDSLLKAEPPVPRVCIYKMSGVY